MLGLLLGQIANSTITVFAISAGSCGSAVSIFTWRSPPQHRDVSLSWRGSMSYLWREKTFHNFTKTPQFLRNNCCTLHKFCIVYFWFQTLFSICRYNFFVLVSTVLPLVPTWPARRWLFTLSLHPLFRKGIHRNQVSFSQKTPAISFTFKAMISFICSLKMNLLTRLRACIRFYLPCLCWGRVSSGADWGLPWSCQL